MKNAEQARDLFLKALQIEERRRAEWLSENCQDDQTLLNEVRSLLEHADQTRDRLEEGLGPDDLAPDASETGEYFLQLRCPKCRSTIGLNDNVDLTSVECLVCKSTFNILNENANSETPGEKCADSEIGKYRLIREIGVGAGGTVWLAEDQELRRSVAIKFPHQTRMGIADRERFLREARAAARFSHSNIVGVYEVGWDRGSLFIVSQFIDGQSLKKWSKKTERDFDQVAQIVKTLAEALHFAHERGIVHRDLKPQNVLIDSNGIPHITDFGLAKSDLDEFTMTIEGQVMGTPAYMSPEQARSDQEAIGPATDIYSLGATLYELLVGHPPLVNKNLPILLGEIQSKLPKAPRAGNADISVDLNAICLKCLEKSPADRYESARDLAEDLSCYLEKRPLKHARPVSKIELAWKWCGRNPGISTLSFAILILLLVLAIGGPIAAYQLQKALDATEIAQRNLEIEKEDLKTERNKTKELYEAAERISSDFQQTQESAERTAGALFQFVEILGQIEGFESKQWESTVNSYRDLVNSPKASVQSKFDFAKALNNYGLTLEDEEKFDQAESAYQEAVEIVLRNTENTLPHKLQLLRHYVNLGKVNVRIENWSKAKMAFEKARQIIEDNPNINFDTQARYWSNLASYLKELKKIPEAEKAIRTGIQLRLDQKSKLTGEAKKQNDLALADDYKDLADLGMVEKNGSNSIDPIEIARKAVEVAKAAYEANEADAKLLQSYLDANVDLGLKQGRKSPSLGRQTIMAAIAYVELAKSNLKRKGDIHYSLAGAENKLLSFGGLKIDEVKSHYEKAISYLKADTYEKNDRDRLTLFELQRQTFNYSNFLNSNSYPQEEVVKQLEFALETAKRVQAMGNNDAIELINAAQICQNLSLRVDGIDRREELLSQALELRKTASGMPDYGTRFQESQLYLEWGGLYCDYGKLLIDKGEFEKSQEFLQKAEAKLTSSIKWGRFENLRKNFLFNTRRNLAYAQIKLRQWDDSQKNISSCAKVFPTRRFELSIVAAVGVKYTASPESHVDAKNQFVELTVKLLRRAIADKQISLEQVKSTAQFKSLKNEKLFQELISEFE